VEDVADLIGRHSHQLTRTALAHVTRVSAMEVVPEPTADPVDLLSAVHTGLDLRMVGEGLVAGRDQLTGPEPPQKMPLQAAPGLITAVE
jgi:hypothetical protein